TSSPRASRTRRAASATASSMFANACARSSESATRARSASSTSPRRSTRARTFARCAPSSRSGSREGRTRRRGDGRAALRGEDRGVRLSCAPATLLGESQQTAWKVVRDRTLGPVRAVYAEANWGRIERWHPSPESLYEVGPLVDVGVYPLTILTAMFGPVRRV